MAKVTRIAVATRPMMTAGQMVGQQQVLYALDDTGLIWSLDPASGRGWQTVPLPPDLSIDEAKRAVTRT
jgi:hypothetical protein